MVARLINATLTHKLLTLLLVALMAVWSVVVYVRIPKDIYPDLNAPLVNIITENPGMASEDVERLISLPLESLLSGAPGVTRVRSESTTGDSVVTVEFDWGTDIYHARQIVASKLEQIAGRLPRNTSPPVLGPVSSRMGEVFEFAVTGDGVDPMELRSIADWTIRYQLQGVPGVSFIVNLGGFVKQYQVLLRPEMLMHHRLTIGDVRTAIERSNRNFSGGVLTGGAQETLIKGVGRIGSIDDLRQTVVATRDGVPVCVRDIADVEVGPAFSREAASHNGRDAVSVTVEKQYGGDTLTATANLRERLARIAGDLPAGVAIRTFYDQSRLIVSSLEHIRVSMIIGAALILAVMLIFMWDVRAALIASLTIPFSIAIALALMDLAGVALTVMSIGGLAIGIGKMANGSIIMVENIYRVQRERAGQASPDARTLEGASEVGSFLVSANLLILLVFLPLMTLSGLEGAMFRPTAFAVAAALLGSMALNLSLQPVLCSCPFGVTRGPERPNPLNAFLLRWYRRLLVGALGSKRSLFAVVLAATLAAALIAPRLGREFVPPLDEGAILASTVMLPETSLEESVAMGKRVERIIMALPEVASVTRTTGSAESSEHLHPVGHSHYAIELKPRGDRTRGFAELTAALRREFDQLPGLGYLFEQPISNKLAEMLTGTEGELSVKLFGPDLAVLGDRIEDVRQVLASIEGVEDLQVEQTAGIPQLVIEVNRERLSRFGISVSEVADVVETALNGMEVTDVYEGERVTAVLVRLPEAQRRDEDAQPARGGVLGRTDSALRSGHDHARPGAPDDLPRGPDAAQDRHVQRRGPRRRQRGRGGAAPAGGRGRPAGGVLRDLRRPVREPAARDAPPAHRHGPRAARDLRRAVRVVWLRRPGLPDHPEHPNDAHRRHRRVVGRRRDAQRVVDDRADRPLRRVRPERHHPGGQSQRSEEARGIVGPGGRGARIAGEVPGALHDRPRHDRGRPAARAGGLHGLGAPPPAGHRVRGRVPGGDIAAALHGAGAVRGVRGLRAPAPLLTPGRRCSPVTPAAW
jgi:cobalt-zinc-cadmium resistance protein CzcA